MLFLDIVILALIQGVTEFLPISSSGHLALWPILTGRQDQGVSMDVAVHLGTLVAVCWYFRADLARMATGVGDVARGRARTADARLVWLLALATLPAIAFGLVLKVTGTDEALRSVEVIGWATLVFGVLLGAADRLGPERRQEGEWRLRDAVLMGLSQALALIPGTSRSGITMTAARALGFERTDAAKLALLMAVPVVLAASVLEVLSLLSEPEPVDWAALAAGAVLSCLAALAALTVMFRMFRGAWTMTPFVVYRLGLGAVLLWIAYV